MRRDALLAILGVSTLALLLSDKARANFAPWDWNSGPPTDETGIDNTDTTPAPESVPLDVKISALLATIRQLESGDDYSIMNGGAHFDSYAAHPGRIYPPGTSTAAGAYQITLPTWRDFGYGEMDFSPAAQDRVAYLILESTGAVDALAANDTPEAVRLAARRWLALKTNPQQNILAAYDMNVATA